MKNDFILSLAYEAQYQSSFLIAAGIIAALEESDVNLQDFLYGVSILLESRQKNDAAALIQKASKCLRGKE